MREGAGISPHPSPLPIGAREPKGIVGEDGFLPLPIGAREPKGIVGEDGFLPLPSRERVGVRVQRAPSPLTRQRTSTPD